MDPADVVLWAIVMGGCILLTWLAWWHTQKHRELDERLAFADPTLVDDASLSLSEAIQAPAGSVVLPYAMVIDKQVVSGPVHSEGQAGVLGLEK